MQPYRLEMGTKFGNARGGNLYEFWGDILNQSLAKELNKTNNPTLINLASNEYFKAVKAKQLPFEIITPQFKDFKNGQYKMISFFAKKARGLMARYMIDNEITQPEDLKSFDIDGYRYDAKTSTATDWVYLRKA